MITSNVLFLLGVFSVLLVLVNRKKTSTWHVVVLLFVGAIASALCTILWLHNNVVAWIGVGLFVTAGVSGLAVSWDKNPTPGHAAPAWVPRVASKRTALAFAIPYLLVCLAALYWYQHAAPEAAHSYIMLAFNVCLSLLAVLTATCGAILLRWRWDGMEKIRHFRLAPVAFAVAMLVGVLSPGVLGAMHGYVDNDIVNEFAIGFLWMLPAAIFGASYSFSLLGSK